MSLSRGIVEIRTLDELSSLYEIAPDCTLTKEQYRNPLRPYRLIRPEASCQYQKNGKRCSQLHQHGFVVELHDDSKVLIGNCCALNHLGLDDEQVRGDFKRLSATERQNIRRHKIETMLNQRTASLSGPALRVSSTENCTAQLCRLSKHSPLKYVVLCLITQ